MFYFHLFELLSFQSSVIMHSQFLHIFVWTIKTTPGGALKYKPIWGIPFFRYHFPAYIPGPGMKQNVSQCSLVELILFGLSSKVEGTQEGHHKLAITAYSRE